MHFLLVLVVAVASAHAGPPTTSATHQATITQLRAESNSAIAARDAERIASFFTEDYQIIAGAGVAYSGPEAKDFRSEFEKSPDIIYVRTPELIEISSSHPLASERGRWVGRWTEGGKAIEVSGSYQAMWRRTDGRWLIRAELFVTLQRAETAK